MKKSNTPEYWGSQGGKARAAKLTPRQRSMAARKAAKVRWERVRQAHEESAREHFTAALQTWPRGETP